jgi:hypothetical protein
MSGDAGRRISSHRAAGRAAIREVLEDITGKHRRLVVPTGTPEANQALGLASPVLLDAGFSTGPAFGAGGTPSAVLVDEDGRIAPELAAGSPAVMALAAGQAPAWDRST